MKPKIYQKFFLCQGVIHSSNGLNTAIIGLSLIAACSNPNEDNAKNDGPTEKTSNRDTRRSSIEGIKNNLLWESLSDSKVAQELYILSDGNPITSTFISSQESYECEGFNSSIFVQNLINDKILLSQEIANNCDEKDWTHNGNQILPILNKSNITIAGNLESISLMGTNTRYCNQS